MIQEMGEVLRLLAAKLFKNETLQAFSLTPKP
jgi:hypothetical protein